MFKNILVPTDGSELSDSTVARAISFAKEAGARITFFYAQPDFPMPIYGEGALIDPTTPEQFSRAAAAEAETILSRARSSAETAEVESSGDTLVSEVPYEAIIEAAERNGCDLIFMASHGRRGPERTTARQRNSEGADPQQNSSTGLSLKSRQHCKKSLAIFARPFFYSADNSGLPGNPENQSSSVLLISSEVCWKNSVARLDAAQTSQKPKKPIEYVAVGEKCTDSPNRYSSCGLTTVKNTISATPATKKEGHRTWISFSMLKLPK